MPTNSWFFAYGIELSPLHIKFNNLFDICFLPRKLWSDLEWLADYVSGFFLSIFRDAIVIFIFLLVQSLPSTLNFPFGSS
jgi:hypothetical protein